MAIIIICSSVTNNFESIRWFTWTKGIGGDFSDNNLPQLISTTATIASGKNRPLLHQFIFTQSLLSVCGPSHSASLSNNKEDEEGEWCGMKNKRRTGREGVKCDINCNIGHTLFPNTYTHWSPGPVLNSGSVSSVCVLVDVNMHVCVRESETKRAGLSIRGLSWHLSQHPLDSDPLSFSFFLSPSTSLLYRFSFSIMCLSTLPSVNLCFSVCILNVVLSVLIVPLL